MRAKLIAGAAALVMAAGTLAASVDAASAAPWGWHRGWGWGWPGAVAAGVIGGAVAAATSPFWAPGYYGGYYDAYPGYVYGPPAYGYTAGPVVAGGDTAYCAARFHSYNPATGTYLGYDGLRHPCP